VIFVKALIFVVMKRIALATSSKLPELYIDDQLFRDELLKLGYQAEAAIWGSSIDWTVFDAVVIRSTWDYHHQLPAFMQWLDELERLNIPVCNPIDLLRWNANKTYLRQLANKGTRTVPTLWLAPSEPHKPIKDLLLGQGWKQAVLKPTVSAGSHLTIKLDADDTTEAEGVLKTILQSSTAMLQPFLPEIQTTGEYSFVFFGGAYQFAMLKVPVPNEYRVQLEFGGAQLNVQPPRHLIEQAKQVMAQLNSPTLYARVDGVDINGQLLLMELELIEPFLFFAYNPGSAANMAQAFDKMMNP
jgi:glutathione synthase/RimK-type ligase-like ATP-grasp enzyme